VACPNCRYVVTPGEEAVEGICPNCERPYAHQPSPTQSEMEMRNMPAPGEEDSGGNPLQEGILGDYQPMRKRDESFASLAARTIIAPPLFFGASEMDPDADVPFDLVDIAPPTDPETVEEVRKEQKKSVRHFTAVRDGRHVGYALVHLSSDQAYISYIFTEPRYRKQGVASALIADIKGAYPNQEVVVESSTPTGKELVASLNRRHASVKVAGPLLAPIAEVALPTLLGEGAAEVGGTALAEGGGAALAEGAPAATAEGLAIDGAPTATRGGIGGLMNAAQSGSPWQWGKNALGAYTKYRGIGAIGDQVMGPGGTMGPSAAPAPGSGVQDPSFYSSTPSIHEGLLKRHAANEDDLFGGVHGEIPSNDLDDPEQVDPHEKDPDQKDQDLQVGQDVEDEAGGAQGFSPESLTSVADLFPLILSLFGEDGGNNPHLNQLHQQLDAEQPGYLGDANEDEAKKLVTAILVKAGMPEDDLNFEDDPSDPTLEDNDAPHDPHDDSVESHVALNQPGLMPSSPQTIPLNQNPNPMPAQGRCAMCGSTINPGQPTCPQCGSLNTPTRNARVADAQGPNSDEQKAVVAEYLQASGRSEEIPEMILHPEGYANELAQVIGEDAPPEQPDHPPTQAMPPMDPSMMGAPGGMPPAPAGGMGMGAPAMASMQRATWRGASRLGLHVDGLAPRCPKCDSHSTGMMSEDGDVGCKSCGHTWKEGEIAKDPHISAGEFQNVLDVPAADQIGQPSPEAQQDVSHTWIDDDGSPLLVGSEYRLYSEKYDVPDIVRITNVKPDSVNFDITSKYGLDAPTEVSFEEAQIEGYHFEPLHESNDENPEFDPDQNMDDIGRPSTGTDVTDESTPHMQFSHTATELPGEVGPDWLKSDLVKSGGARFSPLEQREFIDEEGLARNSDKLDLVGTHYDGSDDLDQSFLW
jgi:GNAT superfamily N-acetyltransferase